MESQIKYELSQQHLTHFSIVIYDQNLTIQCPPESASLPGSFLMPTQTMFFLSFIFTCLLEAEIHHSVKLLCDGAKSLKRHWNELIPFISRCFHLLHQICTRVIVLDSQISLFFTIQITSISLTVTFKTSRSCFFLFGAVLGPESRDLGPSGLIVIGILLLRSFYTTLYCYWVTAVSVWGPRASFFEQERPQGIEETNDLQLHATFWYFVPITFGNCGLKWCIEQKIKHNFRVVFSYVSV